MEKDKSNPFVITISRQLGSGGAYVGQKLADTLSVHCANQDIIARVAKQLSVMEDDLVLRDEKLQSVWKIFEENSALAMDVPIPNKTILPTSRELYEAEAQVIEQIAQEHSSVIVGRCGFHILRNHPNCVKILLYADASFRSKRIQETCNVSENVANEMIAKSDKERSAYIEKFTGKKWTDSTSFDLALDTGKIGLNKSVELILHYLSLL